VGSRLQAKEDFMKCVICKSGDVEQAVVQAEIKVGHDHLMVNVQAEACAECGEAYFSAETLRYFERLKEEFTRQEIVPPTVGKVYQIS
jgi:YgiT-type zinc finger domain-containing protein